MKEYLVKVYKEYSELENIGMPEVKETFTVWGDKVFEVIQERKNEKLVIFEVGKNLIDFS